MLHGLLRSRWPAILWTALIFILLVIPESGLPKSGMLGIPNLDKLAHVVLFGVFVALWFLRLAADTTTAPGRLLLRLFLLSSTYGIAMEFVQLGFTNRAFEGLDILADVLGAGAAAMGIWTGIKRK
jgi:VanZ family protein